MSAGEKEGAWFGFIRYDQIAEVAQAVKDRGKNFGQSLNMVGQELLQSDWLGESGQPEDGLESVVSRFISQAGYQRRDVSRVRTASVPAPIESAPPLVVSTYTARFWDFDRAIVNLAPALAEHAFTLNPAGEVQRL